ncbi:MAG: DUF4870 domain-containing protein [Nannocystaceae bacterium]|nr:DUF4870 domain-containing protein [bacterium]
MIDEREKRLAGVAWAVSGAFGPVVPLIIFALNHKKSKFIAFNALQGALTFLFMLVVAVIAGIGMGAGTLWIVLRDGVPEAETAMPEPLRLLVLALAGLTIAVYLAQLVLCLKYASRASQGEWARYPFISRLAATLYDVSDVRVAVKSPAESAGA